MENLQINNIETLVPTCGVSNDRVQSIEVCQRIDAIKQRIDEKLNRFTDNYQRHPELKEFVTEAYNILMSPDAKRTRSIIPVLVAESLSMDVEDSLLHGVIIELLHFTSLIHDDVIDNDSYRRGYPTLNSTFAKNQAVLIGDYMLCEVVNYCLRTRYSSKVIRLVMDASRDLIAGLIIEQNVMPDNPSLEAYSKMVRRKTGSLISLSFGLPFIADKRMRAAMSCGQDFGFLFQICDDFFDRHQDKSFENIFHIMSTDDISKLWQEKFSALLSTSRKIGIESVVLDVVEYLRPYGYFLGMFERLNALSDSDSVTENILRCTRAYGG